MDFSERLLVLQLGKFKEADLWLRCLSPTRGLFTAFAFGGSRSRRRFVGCLDMFNEIHARVSESRRSGYLALRESVLVSGARRLRTDWPRFGLAVNCVRFLQSFGVGPEGADACHDLMLRTLRLLEEAESVPRLLPLFFRARLAFEQGYSLSAGHCCRCGEELRGPAQLLLREGRIACSRCAARMPDQRLPLGGEALAALEALHRLPPGEWPELELSPGGAREVAGAVDGFIQFHVGISWERGRFVRV